MHLSRKKEKKKTDTVKTVGHQTPVLLILHKLPLPNNATLRGPPHTPSSPRRKKFSQTHQTAITKHIAVSYHKRVHAT